MTQATLVRRIAARPDIVFDALVTAEGIGSWWGCGDIPAISAVSDPRVGGRFEVRLATADGREHVCAGEFLEIARPGHLVMSWRWIFGGEPDERDRVSRLEFRLRPIDIGTELTLVHSELATDVSARSHEGSWAGGLDRLVRRFAAVADQAARSSSSIPGRPS
jgi:uncharacterized protein YndB with AHSA1/START domain